MKLRLSVIVASVATLAGAAALSGCIGVESQLAAPPEASTVVPDQTREPTTAEPTQRAQGAAVVTDADTVGAASVAGGLTGVVWQWMGSEYSNDTSTAVGEPSSYTLQFQDGGDVLVKADCNAAAGTYSATGAGLDIRLAGTALEACDEGSLSEKYVTELGDVATYVMGDRGQLVLNLKMDGGNMIFTRAGR